MSRSVCWAVRLAAAVFTALPLRQRRRSGTTRPSCMQLARPRCSSTTTRNIPLDLSCAIRNAFPQKGAISELIDDHGFGSCPTTRSIHMGQVAQPCGPIDGRAEVAGLVAKLHLAGVHADAQPDRGERRPLQLQGTRHRVAGTRERDHEAVPAAPWRDFDDAVRAIALLGE